MRLPEDRKKLTVEQAYDLVRYYVNQNWGSYRDQLGGSMEPEDVVQDVMLKLTRKKENPDYDPNWKPGDVAYMRVGRSENAPKKEVDTSYMLADDYDPEDPYDSIYHIIPKEQFNYLDKYDGRTTSKKYYIKLVVQSNLNDKVDKRDRLRYAASFDEPDEDGLTLGDRIEDPEASATIGVETNEIKQLLLKILGQLDTEPLSDRIVGHSPITGLKDEDGNPIDTHLTARDIGIYIMYGYTPEDVVNLYHDTRSGGNISISTLSKKWAEALKVIKSAIQADAETLDLWKDRTGKPKK